MLRKLFGRDYRYYRERGDRYLAEGRYADARNEFAEALQRLRPTDADSSAAEAYLKRQVVETGNELGRMNLVEAEHALAAGACDKANDHLDLARDLAEDVTIREKAEKLKQAILSNVPVDSTVKISSSCSGCSGTGHKTPENSHAAEGGLTPEDRFDILVQTLPGNLPERYACLGEKFACGYLLVHDGDDEAALDVFKDLLAVGENDILLYEAALIFHRQKAVAECERLLLRSHALNRTNPLCCLGLVQLYAETGRADEAVPLLEYMISSDILPDQATVLLGDILLLLGQKEGAMDRYGEALTFPQVAGSAAERLIPLLEGEGRTEEAAYLFKRFMKGCC